MQKTKIIICLFTLVNITLASSLDRPMKRGYKYPLSRFEEIVNVQENTQVKELEQIRNLQLIKHNIINGKLDQAKILLREATITDDFSRIAQMRYLALINFLQNNHQEVVKLLNTPEMLEFNVQAKTCLINVLSLMILQKKNILKSRWRDCKSISSDDSNNEMVWMDVLIKLNTDDPKQIINNIFKNINIDNLDKEELRITLKLALYLNQQEKLIPRFELLSEEVLSNKNFRELIGMNYFRNLDLVKTYQLLNGINTPNSEVFKGNLFMIQKKYLKAYGQYKLALQLKENSDNALERLIPLSWQLKQFNEGLGFVKKFNFNYDKKIDKDVLLALFSIMSDDFKAGDIYLRKIQAAAYSRSPVELQQLITYNGIIQNDQMAIDNASYANCIKYDALHCWLSFYKLSWPRAIENLLTSTKIHQFDESLVDKYTSSKVTNTLQQPQLIDQKEIEEMDNDLIKLLKN